MVALRKDVKLGLTLGAIVLSVVGVYVGLTALAGEKASGSGSGATLVATENGGTGKSKEKHSGGSSTTPPVTPIETAGNNRTDASHTPPAGPGNVTPVSPIAAPVAARQPGSAVDPWDDAFASGQVAGNRGTGSGAPSVTTTPDPRAVANNRGPAAQPGDIINALNTPPGGNPAQPTRGSTSNGNTTVANANDGNGSITSGGTSSTLTQVTTHTVANGDTLNGIAAQYYGNGKYYQLIVDANPGINPNRLKIGETLRIPPQPTGTATPNNGSTTRPSTGTVSKPSGPIDPSKQYVVKANDSLHKIADTLYGDSSKWQAIYDLNKAQIGGDPAKLKLGMVLALPTPPTKH